MEVSLPEARAIVDQYAEVLGPLGATVVPFPDALLHAAEPPPRGPRASEVPGWKFEAGVVGAIQGCYDLCTGEASVTGWLWAGGGVARKGAWIGEPWIGSYVFVEGELFGPKKVSEPLLRCGTCAPRCAPTDDHHIDWGAGVAGFPLVLKADSKSPTLFKTGGIEIGGLLTPHRSGCDAHAEVIALVDVTWWLARFGGPIAAAVVWSTELAKKLGKKLNLEIDCSVGIAFSGNVHLCKSVPGGGLLGVTSDSATICGGGYLGCGIGLPTSKAELPGMKASKPAPSHVPPRPAAPLPPPVPRPARPPVRRVRGHGRHGRVEGRDTRPPRHPRGPRRGRRTGRRGNRPRGGGRGRGRR